MHRSGWGPPEKDPRKRAPRWRPTSTLLRRGVLAAEGDASNADELWENYVA